MGRPRAHRESATDVVSFADARRAWFKVSLQTFGGPAGQIAVMHREFVDERRWIGEDRFVHALSYCTLLPGPEAQQLAIYIGWLLNGTSGGLMAGILFVLPGYLAIMALSVIYAAFGNSTVVTALFAGVAPAVLAIVAQALWRVGGRALKNRLLVLVAVLAFMALFAFAVPFPLVIAGAGIVGFVGGRQRPALFTTASHAAAMPGVVPPLIADDALHGEKPSWGRAKNILMIGLALWITPIVALGLTFGRRSIFVEQGTFFAGTALVTFGGAYAVLSYVAQRAVSVYHWLLPGEMIKGLAMAETTPGPLIQVVQFVAFIGAYRDPGTLNPWVAAILAATLVTWVTYVPCFVFIFLGAPHIEALRGNRNLSTTLSAITAAVVGVIANLALFFSAHTLFAKVNHQRYGLVRIGVPDWATFSPRAAAVSALAFVLAFKLRWSVLRILGVCAVVGAALYLVTY